MRTSYRNIFLRTKQMLTQPDRIWPEVLQEDLSVRDTFRNYLFPVAIWISVIVFLLCLFQYSSLQAVGLGIVNLISTISGAWLTYLIIREYLCGKLNCQNREALNLTVYSYTVYILFHSIAEALGTIFIGQMFTLLSFIFLRTLYAGIGQLPHLPTEQKTNLLIITSLTIICIPVIITQLLMIVFSISAITV